MGFFGKVFGNGTKKQGSGMEQATEHHSAASTSTMAKDPICGMDVDINKAAAKSEYEGKTYYFCAPGCKTEFDKNPARYLGGQEQGSTSDHNHGGSCCH